MKGVLKVTVVEAKNLKDQDVVGKSDPYIELWIDKNYKQKTTTKDNTLNPQYNETFTFHVDGQRHLHVRVVDKDIVKDDEIGEGKVDLHNITNGYLDTHCRLPAMLGLTSHGEVHLILEFAK